MPSCSVNPLVSWGVQAGATAGVVFIHWLIYQSVFRIEALRPYCVVVWVVTITAFWSVTRSNVDRGVITVPAPLRRPVDTLVRLHTFQSPGRCGTVSRAQFRRSIHPRHNRTERRTPRSRSAWSTR